MNLNFGNGILGIVLGAVLICIFFYLFFIIFKWFVKRNLPSDVKLRFCPKCGSQKISIFKRGVLSGLYGDATPHQYHCIDCNYKSAIFPVANSKGDLKKIQEKMKKKKK